MKRQIKGYGRKKSLGYIDTNFWRYSKVDTGTQAGCGRYLSTLSGNLYPTGPRLNAVDSLLPGTAIDGDSEELVIQYVSS
jgi:hypothetical protein